MDVLTCLRNSQVIHDVESSHQMSQALKRISSEHDMQLDQADDAIQDCRTCSKISLYSKIFIEPHSLQAALRAKFTHAALSFDTAARDRSSTEVGAW